MALTRYSDHCRADIHDGPVIDNVFCNQGPKTYDDSSNDMSYELRSTKRRQYQAEGEKHCDCADDWRYQRIKMRVPSRGVLARLVSLDLIIMPDDLPCLFCPDSRHPWKAPQFRLDCSLFRVTEIRSLVSPAELP